MIVLIDNYDSFTYNIAQYFRSLGAELSVVTNDSYKAEDIYALNPSAIVLSPGPGTPKDAGICADIIHHATDIPILGICLGMQVIADYFGASVIHAPSGVMHGKTSTIQHNQTGLFYGLPQNFTACRYHSLAVDEHTVPNCLEISARADDGTIMALQHRLKPISGVQFHPEAILSEQGLALFQNFLHTTV